MMVRRVPLGAAVPAERPGALALARPQARPLLQLLKGTHGGDRTPQLSWSRFSVPVVRPDRPAELWVLRAVGTIPRGGWA